jgi:hypothetical protein
MHRPIPPLSRLSSWCGVELVIETSSGLRIAPGPQCSKILLLVYVCLHECKTVDFVFVRSKLQHTSLVSRYPAEDFDESRFHLTYLCSTNSYKYDRCGSCQPLFLSDVPT